MLNGREAKTKVRLHSWLKIIFLKSKKRTERHGSFGCTKVIFCTIQALVYLYHLRKPSQSLSVSLLSHHGDKQTVHCKWLWHSVSFSSPFYATAIFYAHVAMQRPFRIYPLTESLRWGESDSLSPLVLPGTSECIETLTLLFLRSLVWQQKVSGRYKSEMFDVGER